VLPNKFLAGSAVALAIVFFAPVGVFADVSSSSDDGSSQSDAARFQPCLDYWQVGMAGKCAPPKKAVKKAAVSAPSPTIAVAAPPAPVSPTKSKQDEDIDKFQEQYGKPPREFVAFYLNPTAENATKWVHTYQNMLDRNTQLAIAWTQAESLYQNALGKGVPASKFASTTLPAVPDYGVAVPGFTDNPAFYPGRTPPGTQVLQAGVQSLGGGSLPQRSALTNPAAIAQGLVVDPQPATQNGTIEVRYYFSAECPYCQKFQPDFAGLLKESGTKLSTTCVDVTPYSGPGTGPDQSHVAGKLDCAWRALAPGEEDQFGIKETPTILIRRTANGPFERVNGYVPIDTLKQYLFNAPAGGNTPQISDAPIGGPTAQ
jgi:hypothetical protein